MVHREQLRHGGLRAYELGRLRRAVQVAWLLVPGAVLCALETGASETCACIGVLLLIAAVFLRWRNRQGADSVHYGLAAGGLPLIAGLIVARIAPHSTGARLDSVCTAVCLGVGAASGLGLGLALARSRAPLSAWLVAIAIAVLTAGLGCIGLGVTGIASVAAALLVGTAAALLVARAATRTGVERRRFLGRKRRGTNDRPRSTDDVPHG